MIKKISTRLLLLTIITIQFLFGLSTLAQTNVPVSRISGTIIDGQTKDPIAFANITIEGVNTGVVADVNGKFRLNSSNAVSRIVISSLGYETLTLQIKPNKSQNLEIKLKQTSTSMDEVTIKSTKKRFRKKNNPAIDLIDSVVANKNKNRPENLAYYEYEKYQKLQFAFSNITEEFKKQKMLKEFQFVFETTDTTTVNGKPIVPIYIKEDISDFYYRKSPQKSKEIIKAQKMIGLGKYVDNNGMSEYFKYLYQDINVFDNNIPLLTKQFLSPTASTATLFYKYFILDTVFIDNQKCIKLFFSPFNKADFLFQGFMYVMPQNHYALKQIELYTAKSINLNWVRSLNVTQKYSNIDSQGWVISEDHIGIDFGITENSVGIYGQRNVSYKNQILNQPRADSLYLGTDVEMQPEAQTQDTSYWTAHRHEPLKMSEKQVYVTVDSIMKVPMFKRTMDLTVLLTSGYKEVGHYEIGPVNTFYSFNDVEGSRVRLGGRTTSDFSKKTNLDSYVAYGFKDQKWKYYISASYSLTDKTIYQFPVKAITVNYIYDTKTPGQQLINGQEDNLFLSFRRCANDKIFYVRSYGIEYLHEFENHLSISPSYQYLEQSPGGNLFFNYADYTLHQNDVSLINSSEIGLKIRYAPKEQFYQGKTRRSVIPSVHPIYVLKFTAGSKFIGNDYNYQTLNFSVSKRFYFSVFGYSDVILEGDKIFGTVPFPLLLIHRANQTYSYQKLSYNLMNTLEFVSDESVSLNISHCFNGFFFNKIPLFKRLKWREVATLKIIEGHLSDRNNPNYHSNLFKLPTEEDGTPLTYTLNNGPYTEASVGISNIFKVFRVDLVRRLAYMDHTHTPTMGVRVRLKLDF